MQTKYVVILGSLLSGLGKGGITSSVLKILDFYGYSALPMKFDGYLNYDCGTMNPFRHGEVFVLDDKSEVDMDFGMYERFINKSLNGSLSLTGGKLFSRIIEKERRGDYLGEDIQIIPHLTNEIISTIEKVAEREKPEVLVIEVGGTVGDIENSYFIEAMRQLASSRDVTFINLTYVPKLEAVGEQKTKPTQIGIRSLMQLGIRSDFVVCRCEEPLEAYTRKKIALHAGVDEEHVIDDSSLDTVYGLPLHFMEQGFDRMLLDKLGFRKAKINKGRLAKWKALVSKVNSGNKKATIVVVGKYTALKDAYVSVKEALIHAGVANGTKVEIKWVDSTELEEDENGLWKLQGADGILVPGGFGNRGIEGMILAIEYARENRIPYLGLCLGMQLMVVEYARNVCGLKNANSSEFDKTAENKVIDIIESQRYIKQLGGTMRLGSWPKKIKKGTFAYEAYKAGTAEERHRHRYEFNNRYRNALERAGLVVSATTPDNSLVEMVEWKDSFGLGTQAHPELKSRLENPAPLFVDFIAHAAKMKGGR